eukprot:4132944-Amphidinium_carterae.1
MVSQERSAIDFSPRHKMASIQLRSSDQKFKRCVAIEVPFLGAAWYRFTLKLRVVPSEFTELYVYMSRNNMELRTILVFQCLSYTLRQFGTVQPRKALFAHFPGTMKAGGPTWGRTR